MKTTDESVIAQLTEANPVPESAAPSAQERAQAERLLDRVLAEVPAPRRHLRGSGFLAAAVSVVVVLVVAAVVLRTGGSATPASPASHSTQITLRPATLQPQRVTQTAISRTMAVIRARLASLGHGFAVRQSGADAIVVTLPRGEGAERARIAGLITQPGRLRFFDWEANVLTPNGRTVASQLVRQNSTALSLSQGANSGAGAPGAGSSSLYDAVTVASRQPRVRLSRFLSRLGPEYYMFGTPGSAACAAAAAGEGTVTPPGDHCLLAGPLDPGSASRPRVMAALAAQLPAGVKPSDGKVLAVPQGTLVVQAEQRASGAPVPTWSPTAQFFVMRDRIALAGDGFTHPAVGTDESGAPDVTFGFTATGRAAFRQVTRAIAHRGAEVSRAGMTLNQHFAVALDDQLLTVPQIDFKQYPDGITAANGADIAGGLSARAARDLVTQLRYGPLPLPLREVR